MKTMVTGVLVFAAFCAGLWIGSDMTWKMTVNRCEQRVVDSYQSGDPFIFLNNEPVVIAARVRPDRSVVYNAMKADTKVRIASEQDCAVCHGGA